MALTLLGSYAAPATAAQGLASDGTSLWVSDNVADVIYERDPATGAAVSSFASPGPNPQGLAWDGSFLWNVDLTNDRIYKIDVNASHDTDGTILSTITSPSTAPRGVAFDGTDLWIAEDGDNRIYRYSLAGTQLGFFTVPVSPSGLTWDGTHLWVAAFSTTLRRYTTAGVLASTITIPAVPNDIAWDGANLWMVEGGGDTIQKLDATGASLSSIPVPSGATGGQGITFVGSDLYLADDNTDRIFLVDQATGTGLYSFAAPNVASKGIAWDGTDLWVSNINVSGSKFIYRVRLTQRVKTSIPAPDGTGVGLTFDGTNLRVSSTTATAKIFEVDPAGGSIVAQFSSPSTSPRGLGWDGTNLWHVDANTDLVYKLDPATGAVLESAAAPSGLPTGLDVRDNVLYLADEGTDLIYRYSMSSRLVLGPLALN